MAEEGVSFSVDLEGPLDEDAPTSELDNMDLVGGAAPDRSVTPNRGAACRAQVLSRLLYCT